MFSSRVSNLCFTAGTIAPNEHWRLFFGPGYEFHGKKDKFLLRTGVAGIAIGRGF
jgi:hypothetical protein